MVKKTAPLVVGYDENSASPLRTIGHRQERIREERVPRPNIRGWVIVIGGKAKASERGINERHGGEVATSSVGEERRDVWRRSRDPVQEVLRSPKDKERQI